MTAGEQCWILAGTLHLLLVSGTTSPAMTKWPQFRALVEGMINKVSDQDYGTPFLCKFDFDETKIAMIVSEYKTIDFILPGQLGFSLLFRCIWCCIHVLPIGEIHLSLKRFFATLISRTYITLAKALQSDLSRCRTAIVIITAGRFYLDLHLFTEWKHFENACLEFYWLLVFKWVLDSL